MSASVTASAPSQGQGARPVLASFPDYASAQALVDRLSDAGFPVEHVAIIGEGIKFVEKVTGRLTWWKALLRGLWSGALIGLFVGLLFGLFLIDPAAWLSSLLQGLLLGALFGAALSLIAYLLSGGRRDFESVGAMAAERFDVLCHLDHLEEARRHLPPDAPAA